MKTFIKKSILFLLIPIVYIGFNIAFNYYQIKNTKPIIPPINCLILGDSFIQLSMDPDYFNSAVNYAKSGEPYYITYWKLKYIFNYPNVSIDTVLLGFNHHDVSGRKDLALTVNGASDHFKRFYSFHYLTEKDSLEIDYYKYFNVLFRNLALYPKAKHYFFQGEFKKPIGNLKNRDFYNKPIKRHDYFYYKNIDYGVSKTNINYLDSIINFCNSRNTKLILVGTPVSKKYYKSLPKGVSKKYQELKSEYKLKGIKVHDFSQAITEDSLFLDFNHFLNSTYKRNF